ncbi:hypothetical protein PV387_41475 [Streptomyces sp. ME02-6987-2C]|uniref:hypothetical protein n=1 Tax=unclassified Streptomyces TaxID=2593676 RepID=UPI0029B6DA1B|nr:MULTISPECIES: hypothetical protein [unclassified Streptomyces]MDX3372369.1 hypothetical protein [Streptomyces sp. ME02-6987-2C]MDX3426352.1 hypothetical protein [Streptomyces sp. ME02-6985-2c]
MAADAASTSGARRPTPLAPLPRHRNVNTPRWQELWRHHAHITTPLRERGLVCDIEFGLNAYYVYVSLPDDGYLIISPPQEQPSDRQPGTPEGWIVTRNHPDDRALFEIIYDSAPNDDPNAPQRPETRHGGSTEPMIEAIDHRLNQLGLLPHSSTPTETPPKLPASTRHPTPEPAAPHHSADPTATHVYGDMIRALTDQLNGTESHANAAALLHQILAPADGVLATLGDFFEAAAEKAKEAEEDDGFDLSYDLADAAAEIRDLKDMLHSAEERMRTLTPLEPASQRPTASPPVARALPPPVPPPGKSRHTR